VDAGLSLDDLRGLPAVVDLLTAARAFGLGRTRAYELAARGEFPCRVLRIGGTYRVPTADLLAVLGLPTTPHPRPRRSDRVATRAEPRSTGGRVRRETPETRDPDPRPAHPF